MKPLTYKQRQEWAAVYRETFALARFMDRYARIFLRQFGRPKSLVTHLVRIWPASKKPRWIYWKWRQS